jgi:periplasmic mercuric ion binding protein
MKIRFTISMLALLFSANAFSQPKIVTANIKVYGNCVMCKKRIETALDQPGIKKAVWDVKTKNLEVVYNASKLSLQKINETLAAAGHDTESVKAKEEIYATLPFCCLYRDHAMDVKMNDHKQPE